VHRSPALRESPRLTHRAARAAHPVHRALRLAAALGAVVLAGCRDTLSAPPLGPATSATLWRVTIDQKAINLALTPGYDTIQLTATPRNIAGDPLADVPAPVFTSTTPDAVETTADGRVTARKTTSQVAIVAAVTVHGVTYADTAMVRVVAAPPPRPLAIFSIHPADSAKVAAGSQKALAPALVAKADDSTNIANLLVYYYSLDPDTAATVPTGLPWSAASINGNIPGHARLVATTTAFGVTKADTVRYRVGLPVVQNLVLSSYVPVGSTTPVYQFSTTTIPLGVGGSVAWINPTEQLIDLVFDDTTNVASTPSTVGFCFFFWGDGLAGNVEPFNSTSTGGFCRKRTFSVPGTYTYHSTILPNITGTITVVAEPPETP
jgi:plastocyanin